MSKDPKKVKAGKAGADKTHARRYKLLKIVSGQVDKQFLNFIMKWPTKHIEILVASWERK